MQYIYKLNDAYLAMLLCFEIIKCSQKITVLKMMN